MSLIHHRNPSRADRAVAFINALPIVDGPAYGRRFKVDPWMEAWLRAVLEPEKADGSRVVRTAGLSCARKNAKSYLIAGLVLVFLVGPENRPNAQVYSAACDREQASVIFNMMRKMILMTPELSEVLDVIKSTKTIAVKDGLGLNSSGSIYKALSADSDTKHGLGPDIFIYDEFGEAPKKDELFDTLIDGQQLKDSPLAVIISTQNPDPQHPMSIMIDDAQTGADETLVFHLHAADDDCDLMDRDQWIKANPALLTWKPFDQIETKAKEAKRNPAKESNFRRRYLNQRVNNQAAFLTRTDWMACLPGGKFPRAIFKAGDTWSFAPGEALYGALDMSITTDLSAMVFVSAENGNRVKSYFYKPLDLIEDHSGRDDFRYDLMADLGWLQTPPGRVIDETFILHDLKAIMETNPVLGLAYDPAYMRPLLKQMEEIGLIAQEGQGGGLRLVKWPQGFITMGKAVKATEKAVLEGTLKSDGNPILSANIAHAIVEPDPAGNRKFFKNKSRQRIDGAVAMAMALGLKAEDMTEAQPFNAFETKGFTIPVF
ncbi:terminase large subunit [Brevundimonas sp.]|uniref:terminase large subunit n=1 Tax=Brevundimonas sp. TaxID=1871086 RepID=UPI0035AEAB15